MKTIQKIIMSSMFLCCLTVFRGIYAMDHQLSRPDADDLTGQALQALDTFVPGATEWVAEKANMAFALVEEVAPELQRMGKTVSDEVRNKYDQLERAQAIIDSTTQGAEAKSAARETQLAIRKDLRAIIRGFNRDIQEVAVGEAPDELAIEGSEANNNNGGENNNNLVRAATNQVVTAKKRDIFAPQKRAAGYVALISACCQELKTYYADLAARLKANVDSENPTEHQREQMQQLIVQYRAHEGKVFEEMAGLLAEVTKVDKHDISTIYQGLTLVTGRSHDAWQGIQDLIYHVAARDQDLALVKSGGFLNASIQAFHQLVKLGAQGIPQEIKQFKNELEGIQGKYKDSIARQQALIDASWLKEDQRRTALIALEDLRRQQVAEFSQAVVKFEEVSGFKVADHAPAIAQGMALVANASSDGAIATLGNTRNYVVALTREYPALREGLSDLLGNVEKTVVEFTQQGDGLVDQFMAERDRYERQEIEALQLRLETAQQALASGDQEARDTVVELQQRIKVKKANKDGMKSVVRDASKGVGFLAKGFLTALHGLQAEIDPSKAELYRSKTVQEAFDLSNELVSEAEFFVMQKTQQIVTLQPVIEKYTQRVNKLKPRVAALKAEIAQLQKKTEPQEDTDEELDLGPIFAQMNAKEAELRPLEEALADDERSLTAKKKSYFELMREVIKIRAQLATALADIDVDSLVEEHEVQPVDPRIQVVEEPKADAAPQQQAAAVSAVAPTGRTALVSRTAALQARKK